MSKEKIVIMRIKRTLSLLLSVLSLVLITSSAIFGNRIAGSRAHGFSFLTRTPQGALEERIAYLSKDISDGLTENQKRTIAVVEFADLRGNVTDFGRFIAEELITRLHQTKKFKVIERQLLNKILSEQKLSLTGMIDQTSAQRLGKLLGVDAIASGTVTDLGKSFRVNARLIDTSTGEIFAVASAEITKDDSVLALMGAGAPGPTTGNSVLTSASDPNNRNPGAIGTKDIGSLRVVLKSVMPMKLKDQNGLRVNGIRCSFEFVNSDAQRVIGVAFNAIPQVIPTRMIGSIGEVLRTTLVDEGGTIWTLSASGLTRMSIVSVGRRSYSSIFSPTDIPSLLQRQDEMGTNLTTDANYPQLGEFPFVFGSTTPIPPGSSITFTMTFVQSADQAFSQPEPRLFQFESEVVVGVATSGTKKSYSLHNLTFDRVSTSAGGS